MDPGKLKMLPDALLPWYDQNKRDLPWRKSRDPYRVWLSEIMLQQTRVEAVKGYYARFLEALPSVSALADADDDTLHKLWEGLGYYSRVRNLKKAAIRIMEDHGGAFPGEYDAIRALPGIGDYTAGAICSICFDQPTPAVDGNVLRVISRICEDPTPIDLPARKKAVRDILESVYPVRAGDFTQALMELGATLCGPNRKPQCEDCPCREFCGSALNGTAAQFPVKLPKREKKVEERTVFILCREGEYALRKRPDTGLLAGLWEFPNVSGKLDLNQIAEVLRSMGISVKDIRAQLERVHIFTHIRWEMRGFYLEVSGSNSDFTWMTRQQIDSKTPLPTAFRQFWEEADHV